MPIAHTGATKNEAHMTDSAAIFLAYVKYKAYCLYLPNPPVSFAEFRSHRLEIASYYR